MGRNNVIAVAMLMACASSWSACAEEREDAQQAVNAAKALMDMAKQGEQAEQAAKEAEAAAREQIPEGASPEEAQKQIDLAKGLAAMKALGKGGGPTVNWRKLAPMLPDKLGSLPAKSELKGSTKKAGGFEFSEVNRRYGNDNGTVRVKITDASTTPFLRAPFAMAAMVEEDTSSGYKKGKKIAGHTAIVEWREQSKRSSVTMLVAERFIVDVKVDDADRGEVAELIVKDLDIDGLAKLKADAPAEEVGDPG